MGVRGDRRVIATAISIFAAAPSAFGQQSLPAIEVGAAHGPHRRPSHPVRQAQTAPRAMAQSVPAQPEGPPAAPASPPLRGVLAIAPNALTVVDKEELRRLPGATLGDVLFSKPGVTGSSYAPGAASRPIVRGLDNYRVRIQENGLGASGVSALGEDHGVPLDPLGANQIEVLRGPATLRLGPAASGGVVSVSNNRIPDKPPCDDAATFRDKGCMKLETRAAVSTVDNGLENATLLDAGQGNFLLHADATGRRASDYRIPAYPYLFPPDPPPPVFGRQPNSAARMGGASLGATYLFERGHVGVSVTQFWSLYHIPGFEPTAADTRIDMRQTRIAAKGEVRPRSGVVETIRFWAGLSDYQHNELGNEGGYNGVQQTFTDKSLETRVEAQLSPIALPVGALKSSIGVQGFHQALTAPGVDGGLFDPNRTKSVAGFVFNELSFTDALRLQAAARVDHAQIDGAIPDFASGSTVSIARSRNFTPVSGAMALLQDLPGGLVASVNAQYVQRAPRAPELFSRGPHDATGTFDVGNPDLRVETAKTLEISLRRAAGPFRFEANLFETRFDGFIFRNLTGQSCDASFASCTPLGEGGALAQAVYAQRNAVFRGAEFQSQIDAAPLAGGTLGVESQFDVVRASFSSGGNVPRIPPVRLGGGLFWRDGAWLARVNLLHAFAQNNIAATGETPTKGYNLLKAELSYRMIFPKDAAFGREMTLGIVGNNLLNQDIRNSVSYRKDQVLMPGANLRLFANLLF